MDALEDCIDAYTNHDRIFPSLESVGAALRYLSEHVELKLPSDIYAEQARKSYTAQEFLNVLQCYNVDADFEPQADSVEMRGTKRPPSPDAQIAPHGDINSYRSENEGLRAENACLVEKVAELEKKLAKHQLRRTTLKGGVGKGHLTPAGDFRLWSSRNCGHVDAASLLHILAVKGHKSLVLRSERRGGAAFMVKGRERAQALTDALREGATRTDLGDVGKMWHCVVIRTDAFSSQVSRTDAPKLQVTQLLVGCSCSGSSVLELWPDLAGVDIGNSYEFCETVVAQLQLLGCWSWRDDVPANVFCTFFFIVDDGPDCNGGVRLAIEEVRGP